jgi:hypothetical protein
VAEKVLPGELGTSDVITLPAGRSAVVVRSVRLGSGGFIISAAPAAQTAPSDERLVTLTAWTAVMRHGRSGPGRP